MPVSSSFPVEQATTADIIITDTAGSRNARILAIVFTIPEFKLFCDFFQGYINVLDADLLCGLGDNL